MTTITETSTSARLDSYPAWCGYMAATVRALLDNGDDIDRRIATDGLAHYDAWRHGQIENSPLGDRREHAVPCSICREPTFNWGAKCNTHMADAS